MTVTYIYTCRVTQEKVAKQQVTMMFIQINVYA